MIWSNTWTPASLFWRKRSLDSRSTKFTTLHVAMRSELVDWLLLTEMFGVALRKVTQIQFSKTSVLVVNQTVCNSQVWPEAGIKIYPPRWYKMIEGISKAEAGAWIPHPPSCWPLVRHYHNPQSQYWPRNQHEFAMTFSLQSILPCYVMIAYCDISMVLSCG